MIEIQKKGRRPYEDYLVKYSATKAAADATIEREVADRSTKTQRLREMRLASSQNLCNREL